MVSTSNPTIKQAEQVLRSRFGFPSFRPGQREAIELLLATNDHPRPGVPPEQSGRALAVFPTGAGKSLCYQLPGFLFDDGLTLVVSPLMALMKDQTDALVKKGFCAACLDSSLSAAETRDVFSRVRARDIRLLFVSPERFNNTRFIQLLKAVRLSLFAVDEAHCISEWGHSFRPDYLRLSRWADRLGCQRRLALTATATPRVAQDICVALNIPYPSASVRTPSVRPNLTTRITSVQPTGSTETLESLVQPRVDLLVSRLKDRDPGPTIVYVTLQATASKVAEMLRERGFYHAACYHAGMKQEDRKRTQDEFMANTKDALVVATIAFGMGMDHSSIRYVYHLNMPKSLEGYIQEIGRAGRDGLPSICETFACIDDVPTLEAFIFGETPSRAAVGRTISELFDGAEVGSFIEYSTYDLCFGHDIRDTCMGQILAQLDISEGCLEESTPYYGVIDLRMHPMTARRWPPKGSRAAKLINLSSVKKSLITVDVANVAENMDMNYGQVSRLCDDMVVDGYMVEAKSRKLRHRARVKMIPDDLNAIADTLHGRLVSIQQRQIRRLHEVLKYFSAKECQTLHLANHLGDEYNATRCGHCEFCLNRGVQPVKIWDAVRAREAKKLDERRWALIQLEDIPKDNPLLMARFAAGISSPVISRRYRRLRTFGSMSDHDFNVLLHAANKDCQTSE
ncbi:putative ATP-dependent DNA helicase RecS [Gracilariopsis chorda]|uniref:ATP-dependent DNA helicase n=1 Tax=Gracilariopsis chorda TaxID=448386 RepID=A0A2V3ITQ8_9FLOR|nr:putative ATP-dependent DNA helicase RecS [Gracilariopsis chorda]|eukprot:PXF44500.1 putative ATP-dependent DNA helicase RecS [Gracilariopsis chorda]